MMTLRPRGIPQGLLVCAVIPQSPPVPMVLVLAKGTVLGRALRSRLCHFKAVWLWSKHLTFLSLSFLINNRGFYCVTLMSEDKVS